MKIDTTGNGKVVIDGREFSGRSISIANGKVIVDGVTQSGELIGEINVTVHGDVERIENGAGTVKANAVGNISTHSGDVECGDVSGSVKTMSGGVTCGAIQGNVSTMAGDIHHR